MDHVRTIVSKRKRRFREVLADGTVVDLDLTYITDRIIAMGFPSEGGESLVRNPMDQVRHLLDTRHPDNYTVINLCSERTYSVEGAFDRVLRFPFDDHNPAPLELVHQFCVAMDRALRSAPDHVVAVHCKAGKGRTGLMVSAYLVHCGACGSAREALAFFGRRRTVDGKGVTIPSQQRYCWYYEQWLRATRAPPELSRSLPSRTLQLVGVRLITIPYFDVGGGCDPYLRIFSWCGGLAGKLLYDQQQRLHAAGEHVRHFHTTEQFTFLDLSAHEVLLRGDCKLELWDEDRGKSDDFMCACWFHTGFISSNYLVFDKSVLDGAHKDRHARRFHDSFRLELFFAPVMRAASGERVTADTARRNALNTDAGFARFAGNSRRKTFVHMRRLLTVQRVGAARGGAAGGAAAAAAGGGGGGGGGGDDDGGDAAGAGTASGRKPVGAASGTAAAHASAGAGVRV